LFDDTNTNDKAAVEKYIPLEDFKPVDTPGPYGRVLD
jgi:hypothetical protein